MSEPTPRPAIAAAPLSVILFAQALAADTPDVVRSWRHYLDTLARSCEILLIQETRPEVTPNPVAAEVCRVFSYERSAGFRAALNEAIHAAQHPLLVFCPCDRQYRPADLAGFLKVIDKVDLVTGYRTGTQAPLWRVLLDTILGLFSRVVIGVPLGPRVSWLGSEGWGRRWVARWVFGVPVVDPECPFRLVRRELFERLPIQSGGPFVQVEILAKANHRTCYFAEEPVSWTPPPLPASEAIPFGHDAWNVFRKPDFGKAP